MTIINTRIQWKAVSREPVTRWSGFYVSLNRKGAFGISRNTYQELGSPPAFQIFFDPPNSRIGLKPSALAGRDAFPVYRNKKHGSVVIYARRLLIDHGIDIPETIRFPRAETDHDGILVLDLRTAVVPKEVKNHRYNKNRNA